MSKDNTAYTVQDAMRRAVHFLTSCGIEEAARDVRRLMAAALEVEADRLTLHTQDKIDAKTSHAFDAYCLKRSGHEPVSRILGGRLFYGRWFKNSPYVLDPRPETEILIERALTCAFQDVLDLGTGSGCIALTLLAERPKVTALATDISPEALETARENAKALGVSDRAHFEISDWFEAVAGQFDLIVSNPPYIHPNELGGLAPEVRRFDPKIALSDTKDGLSGYRRIASKAMAHLAPGGRVLVEIGPTQALDVLSLFKNNGLQRCAVYPDLDGRDRVIEGHAPEIP